jgi:ABC-type transport system substrate-binding protein
MDEGFRYRFARRVSRRNVLRGGAVGVVGLGLAGCGTNPAPPAAPTATSVGAAAPAAAPSPAAAAPKYGGTLKTNATFAERNMDPHVANGAIAIGNVLCYSQLLTYKWGKDIPPLQYTPGPDLAESWTQPDETTYVFKLRPGVKFHNIAPVNGRELVADDVVFSFQRIRDLKSFASQLAGVTKFEAPDPSTVKLTLDKPNADLLINLCFWNLKVVAKEAVAVTGNLEQPPVIGTGPWLFDKWVPNQLVALKRNPDYFLKGRPYADAFESYRTTDPSALVESFRGGAINVLGSGLTAEPGQTILKSLPKTQAIWIPQDRSQTEMGLKVTVEPFGDIRVRQAINKAIDRKAIIETIFLGRAAYSSGVPMPGPDWNLPQAELGRLMARDVEGAKKLMKDAGKESGFDLEVIVPTYLAGVFVTMGELIQSNLKEIGIRITLKTLDSVAFSQQQLAGNFQAYISANGVSATNATLYNRIYTGGAGNYLGYSNQALDKLIDQQAVLTKDTDARKKLLQDIQRTIIAESAFMNLGIYEQPTLAVPEIRDFYPPTTVNFHNDFWSTLWFDK